MSESSCTIPAAPRSLAFRRRRSFSPSDVERYRPLVRRLAGSLRHRLPSTATTEDLESAGWIALMECRARNADTVPAHEFEDFAACRVRGAMLDFLRALQPGARIARSAVRRATRATKTLETQLGRATTEDERATILRRERDKAPTPRYVDADDSVDLVSREASPEEVTHLHIDVERLRAAITALPERLQTVLVLVHVEECTHVEVARILSISPSRASQLHADARDRLRLALASLPPPAHEISRRRHLCHHDSSRTGRCGASWP